MLFTFYFFLQLSVKTDNDLFCSLPHFYFSGSLGWGPRIGLRRASCHTRAGPPATPGLQGTVPPAFLSAGRHGVLYNVELYYVVFIVYNKAQYLCCVDE